MEKHVVLLALLSAATGLAAEFTRIKRGYWTAFLFFVSSWGCGAILSLASISFGILYFLDLNKAKDNSGPWGGAPTPDQGNIA